MGAFARPTVEQKHKCINWEKFDAWNAERRVDLFNLDALEGRPSLSPVRRPSLISPALNPFFTFFRTGLFQRRKGRIAIPGTNWLTLSSSLKRPMLG